MACMHICVECGLCLHLFAGLTYPTKPAGSWRQRWGPLQRSESHWEVFGWLCRHSDRPSVGPLWSSAGSWLMRSTYGSESSGSLSLVHNSE